MLRATVIGSSGESFMKDKPDYNMYNIYGLLCTNPNLNCTLLLLYGSRWAEELENLMDVMRANLKNTVPYFIYNKHGKEYDGKTFKAMDIGLNDDISLYDTPNYIVLSDTILSDDNVFEIPYLDISESRISVARYDNGEY